MEMRCQRADQPPVAMTPFEFEMKVARLELHSARHPVLYRWQVALLALAGFAVLAMLVAGAVGGLLLIASLPVIALWLGWGALLALLKTGKLLWLLVIPLWLLAKATITAVLTRIPRPDGLPLAREQAPGLFAAMDGMRRRMRGPLFDEVLLTDEMNAAVVQRPSFGLLGWPRNYLLIGLPLLDSLPPEEALAVVAHEYGHLAGSHGRFGAFIYRLRQSWQAILDVSAQWSGWGGRLLRKAAAWYAPHFNAYSFVLARADEYAADAAAGRLVGAPIFSAALKRVGISVAHHRRFVATTFQRVADHPQPPADMLLRWAVEAAQPPADDARRWLSQALDERADVADTHPVLRDRLVALGEPAAETLPPPRQNPVAAQAWLGHHLPALRSALSRYCVERLREDWGRQFAQIQRNVARLAELARLDTPSAAEWIERIRLQTILEPHVDQRPAIAALSTAHPEQPMAMYLLGTSQLQYGDAAGLDALDRAMALDVDMVKPSCEFARVFCHVRGDGERAEAYQRRWTERDSFERQRSAELGTLDLQEELQGVQLPTEVDTQVRGLLEQHGGVAQAWLVRRVLRVDPSIPAYLLVVRPRWLWAHYGVNDDVIKRLSLQDWPFPHLLLCNLGGRLRPLKTRLPGIPDVWRWSRGR